MMLLGLVQIVVYFGVFSFLIKKFNYKTPGREDENTSADKEPRKQIYLNKDIANIINGLGGKENINTVESLLLDYVLMLKMKVKLMKI